MKLVIIGTVVRDWILHYDGRETHSLGGIYYTLAVAANLCPPDWEIHPICRVGKDVFPEIMREFSRYPNVNLTHVLPSRRENTRVKLVYVSPTERIEYTTRPMRALTREEVRSAVDADAVLVNYISGFDLRLSALKFLSQHSDGLIYLDFHSRTLGIAEDGRRFLRRPRRWKRYLELADILQMNEVEARCLFDAADQEASVERLVPCLTDFLRKSSRPRIVNLTLGEKGSLLIERARNRGDGIEVKAFPSEKVEVKDPTGCGDTFAIAFLVEYLRSGDAARAAQFANRAAGLKCTLRGAKDLGELKQLLDAKR